MEAEVHSTYLEKTPQLVKMVNVRERENEIAKGFGILRIINDNVTKSFSRVDQLEIRKKNKIELCLHDLSMKY